MCGWNEKWFVQMEECKCELLGSLELERVNFRGSLELQRVTKERRRRRRGLRCPEDRILPSLFLPQRLAVAEACCRQTAFGTHATSR